MNAYDGPEHGDPSGLVVAYCAPGLRGYAEALLAARGERYRELIEHPWLTGTEVILATDRPVFPLPPFDTPWADRDHDVLADLLEVRRRRSEFTDQFVLDPPRDTWT